MLRRTSSRPMLMALAGMAALAVGAGIALAHGGDASAIHGCVDKEGKGVRILAAPGIGDPNQGCKPNETAIDWSQTGPQGPPGISGYQVVAKGTNIAADGRVLYEGTPVCPTGKSVLGGGGSAFVTGDDFSLQLDLAVSEPSSDGGLGGSDSRSPAASRSTAVRFASWPLRSVRPSPARRKVCGLTEARSRWSAGSSLPRRWPPTARVTKV